MMEKELFHEVVEFVNNNLLNSGIPQEAANVMLMEMYVPYIGSETYKTIQQIRRKFPEYWPWHAKYDNIPAEVHEAYKKEAFPVTDWIMPYVDEDGNSGFESVVAKCASRTTIGSPTMQDFKDLMNFLSDNADRQKKEEDERKLKSRQLWSKHYKKYGLEYSEKYS